MTLLADGTSLIVRCTTSFREKLKSIKNRRAEARMQKLLHRPVPTPTMGNLRPLKVTNRRPQLPSR